MAPAILNYFGLGSSVPAKSDNTALRALPASWYTSPELYELERRAVFSRKWQLVTHKLRLTQPGEWLRYEAAGFQFVLCRDREGNINGFHNICRHRAFPIVTEEKGSSRIFACKYHGWSYGLNGKLAKAPGYQELDHFDKDQNGLLPIHVHIDRHGFIWVNLDAKEKPEIAWEEDFEGTDRQARCEEFNFDEYQFDHVWEMQGDYNWKICADNYNECYHCPTSHPDISALSDLSSYAVTVKAGSILHDPATTPEQLVAGLKVCPTFCFPNASMNVMKDFFFIQRFVPHGPMKSTMRYEVYRNKSASDVDFELRNQMYKRIMSEDKYLCDHAQKNINAGIFVNGELHPRMEKGPLYFQKLLRESVMEHHDREKLVKHEIWPARQNLPNSASVSQQDIEFCSGLACQTHQEVLAW